MTYIFISYSHKDSSYAQSLAKSLENVGFAVWIDERIDYGAQWPHAIEEHLDNCSAFIVVMSSQARKSPWVQNELSRAQRLKKPIFPLLLEGTDSWLSVEATQYLDVRTGVIPDSRFHSELAKYVPRQKIPLDESLPSLPPTVYACILVTFNKPHTMRKSLQKLQEMPEVGLAIGIASGDYDALVIIGASDANNLGQVDRKLRTLPEVMKTSVMTLAGRIEPINWLSKWL